MSRMGGNFDNKVVEYLLIRDWPSDKKKKTVLKSIYCCKRVSRPELGRELRMKTATLYRIIDDLISEQLVEIVGASEEGRVGRRAEVLGVNNRYNYVFSVALKRDSYALALVNLSHEIISKRSYPVLPELKPQDFVAHSYAEFEDMCGQLGIARQQVATLALALVGPLDFDRGVLLGSTYFAAKNWVNVPIFAMFEKQFKKKPVFDTLARAALWGSYIPDFYKQYKNIAYFIVGTGIGSGLILQGKVIENTNRIYDGVAHMTIEIGGRRCICGDYGCLEAYVTTMEIPRIFIWEMEVGHPTSLSELSVPPSFDTIANGVVEGDPLCIHVMRQSAVIFAKAVLNLLRMFDMEAVVIGGEIAEKSAFFYEVVKEYICAKSKTLSMFRQENEEDIILKGIAIKSILPYFEE